MKKKYATQGNVTIFFSRIVLCLTGICILSGNQSVQAVPEYEAVTIEQLRETRITLDAKNLTLEEILQQIFRQSKINYGIRSGVTVDRTKRYSLSVKDVTVEEALKRLLSETPYDYRMEGGKVILIARPTPPTKPQGKHKISGRVVDPGGNPIAGATVIVHGTSIGTATDPDGKFAIPLTEKDELDVSFVGYKSTRVAWHGQTELVVRLEEEATDVGEVVVTGIFTKAKESYTGSVTTITSKDIAAFRGQNLISTLKNIDPSINILSNNETGSDPNSLPQVTIRGTSSMPISVEDYNKGLRNDYNTPLIIMDGFEISLEKLRDYNDNEIESINILKDASATAIYGSRGANGVIVILSKAPESGHLKVTASVGINLEIPDLSSYNLMNASEKLQLENMLGLYNHTLSPTGNAKLQDHYAERLRDVLEGVDTYWLSKPLHTGVGQRYNLRLEGGNEEFRWGASAAYDKTVGAMKGSQRQTFNGAVTLSYHYKNVLFRNQTTVGVNRGKDSPYGPFSTWATQNPYERAYDEQGEIIRYFYNIGKTSTTQNPLYDASLNQWSKTDYTEIINNFSIEWNVVEGLKMLAKFGISRKINGSDRFLPADHSSFSGSEYEGNGYFRKGSYTYGQGRKTSYDGNITLSYSKTFAEKHTLYAGLDASLTDNSAHNYTFIVEGFTNEAMDFLGNALQYQQNGKPRGVENTNRRVGLTGNVNYTYDSRYFADFSVRVDGASQFGSENRYAPFWSVGIGWNLHREHFLQQNGPISMLRIKASVGQTGSQQFSAYQALSTFQYYSDQKYINWSGAELMGHGNKNLKWQMTDEYNLGTEFGFFANRVQGSLDFYLKNTSNLLSSKDTPLSTGFSSYMENIGKVRNKGVEISLSGYPIRNTSTGMVMMLSAKLAYNKNKIVKLSDAIKAQNETYRAQGVEVANLFYEGYSQNSIYAVRSLGIDPSTGDEIYLDRYGNITPDWSASDMVYLGVNEPLFRGNAGVMFGYKNFQLNLSFACHWGGKLYNQTLINKVEVTKTAVQSGNLDRRVLYERWSSPGDQVFFKRITSQKTKATSRFVMDDQVFELQTASLQYRWENAFIQRVGFRSVTVAVNMSDVFYWSKTRRERGIAYPFARRLGTTLSFIF